MPIKEIASTGSKESFHWSYDLIVSVAALSLFVTSAYIYRYERLFALGGFLCGVMGVIYACRPTF